MTVEQKKRMTCADGGRLVMADLKAICDRTGAANLSIPEEVFQLLVDYKMEIEHFKLLIISGV